VTCRVHEQGGQDLQLTLGLSKNPYREEDSKAPVQQISSGSSPHEEPVPHGSNHHVFGKRAADMAVLHNAKTQEDRELVEREERYTPRFDSSNGHCLVHYLECHVDTISGYRHQTRGHLGKQQVRKMKGT
jgi:hypothetical protein